MTKVAIVILTLAALGIAAFPPGAIAAHCTSASESPYLYKHEGDDPDDPSYYVVADRLGNIGIYEETNGKKGLQFEGLFSDSTCHGRVLADERIA